MTRTKSGRKNSRQRQLILSILRNDPSIHPTADWIYEKSRKVIPDISLGTVYRNLKILAEDGEIRGFTYGGELSRFCGRPEPHVHFICKRCGRIHDIEDPLFANWQAVQERIPFKADDYLLEIYGICAYCEDQRSLCFELRGCEVNTFFDEACPQRQGKNCWDTELRCPRFAACNKKCSTCLGGQVRCQ